MKLEGCKPWACCCSLALLDLCSFIGTKEQHYIVLCSKSICSKPCFCSHGRKGLAIIKRKKIECPSSPFRVTSGISKYFLLLGMLWGVEPSIAPHSAFSGTNKIAHKENPLLCCSAVKQAWLGLARCYGYWLEHNSSNHVWKRCGCFRYSK